jgi:hypothetical protein
LDGAGVLEFVYDDVRESGTELGRGGGALGRRRGEQAQRAVDEVGVVQRVAGGQGGLISLIRKSRRRC